jgi:hypothetical protein
VGNGTWASSERTSKLSAVTAEATLELPEFEFDSRGLGGRQ